MIDKIVQSMADAMAGIKDGSTVLVGGFGAVGQPNALIDGLIEQGATDLIVAANNAGVGHIGLARLMELGRVRKIICSFPRSSDPVVFEGLYRAGKIELEIVPQGTLAERMRAAGAGVPAFFTATGVGTKMAMGKETREFDGRSYVMERALQGDVGAGGGVGGRPLGQPDVQRVGPQLQSRDRDGIEADNRADPAHPRTWARSTPTTWSRPASSWTACCMCLTVIPPGSNAARKTAVLDEPRLLAAHPWVTRRPITVAEYHRMGKVGILGERDRVELIEGELVAMSPIGSQHSGTVITLSHLLWSVVGRRALVSAQNLVRLDDFSEPEPDFALLRPRPDNYRDAHPQPADVLLLIEIADTSLNYDRTVKRALYARHVIPEFWIVDLTAGEVEICWQPQAGGYATVDRIGRGGVLEPELLPGVRFQASTMFR